ncbi:biotin-dependent carboxyltransferase family protein [Psychrosphaera aquimarina]|uniref:Biotin-dependent carboxyltransferase family protein n=1 Tax=Psychrosphaera aquimarina TaxID=2044854 RepID=A0ABU3R0M1_9GAMM|nr:biotin-dependent carboxyltransferase family protein [Psychrosphaera aquimarina]MDU0113221.1 biotin-dependent carboxyltransferase family protein [Psychrosphaera aquimarina]
MSDNNTHFVVERPGVLSLIQDAGRFGQTHLGLTQGGPADRFSFNWCHNLLGNAHTCSALEVVIGGLKLKSNCQTVGCVTGAETNVTVNGKLIPMWCTFVINAGDVIEFGFAAKGLRSYFSVSGGFTIKPEFGSCSTVVREKVGGLSGEPLKQGDKLPMLAIDDADSNTLPTLDSYTIDAKAIPTFESTVTLRVILGYQQDWFSDLDIRRFFCNNYQISKQFDRMGYRLKGPKITANKTEMLSEGITLGAIQIPADGQPIILLNDRQTIGGYPKLGSVLSIDLDKLSQCKQGDVVRFEAITIEQAHNILHFEQHRQAQINIVKKACS